MKNIATVLFLSAAVVLSACAYDYGREYGDVGTPYYYDGYYDGYYGSAYGGYWGADGFFYYLLGPGNLYQRDTRRHFRRDAGEGFRPFHLRDPGDHERHERPQQRPYQRPDRPHPHS